MPHYHDKSEVGANLERLDQRLPVINVSLDDFNTPIAQFSSFRTVRITCQSPNPITAILERSIDERETLSACGTDNGK